MSEEKEQLVKRLSQAPAYLLLGQTWAAGPSGVDPLLRQTIHKFDIRTASSSPTYSDILDQPSILQGGAIDWMAGRSVGIVPPESMEFVLGLPWSGIFTSAIDNILADLTRSPERDVQRVTSTQYKPSDPRNRSRLHIWHLYGNVSAPDPSGYPPFRRLDLIKRDQVAVQFSAQIAELLTPIGTICIDGLNLSADWIKPELIYATVSSLQEGQAHWFSSTKDIASNPLINALVTEGKLELHEPSLAEYLATSSNIDDFSKLPQIHSDALTNRIRIDGKLAEIPSDLLRQLRSIGRILSEDAFFPREDLTGDALYNEFRNFLYESSNQPQWQGFARGFSFRRDFQETLESKVSTLISLPSKREQAEPIILHGGTGSGKTLALGQLAYDFQKKGTYPVIFIDRGARVRVELLNRFCEWCEDNGADALLIIWDGMLQRRDYVELQAALKSKGRKFVLVGSAYLTEANLARVSPSLVASPRLNKQEFIRFIAFLSKNTGIQFSATTFHADEESFLGQLYRRLPSTRSAIQAGLGREVDHATNVIRASASEVVTRVQNDAETGVSLRQLFDELDLEISSENSPAEITPISLIENDDEVRRLIGLVMVPGQFGIKCPFELIVRVIGWEASERLIRLVKAIDLFHLREDEAGDPLIEPRTALEAQLIVRRAFAGAAAEIEYVEQLLGGIRHSFVSGTREIDFAVELLRNVGPNGNRERYFQPFFGQLAHCLRSLRIKNGVRHVRLLLQESAFFREAAKIVGTGEQDDISRENLRGELGCAIEACEEALSILSRDRENTNMRSRLLVEKASALGTLAALEENDSSRRDLISKAHLAALAAFGLDANNNYALDVVAWSGRDVLIDEDISEDFRIEVAESVAYAFSLADAQRWDAEAANQLDRRRAELGELVFGLDAGEAALKRLLQRGSAAGVVLKAWQLHEKCKSANKSPQECARVALEWIDQPLHSKVVSNDARARFLRFRMWWLSRMGFEIVERERITCPFDQTEWREGLLQVESLLADEDLQDHPILRLVEAVALFHRGEVAAGFDAFERMGQDLLVVRERVVKRFVMSEPTGKAKRFSGSVVKLQGRNGLLKIAGFPRYVRFFADEVLNSDLRLGDDLQGFGVAFNMVGPIAEFRIN